MKNQPKAKQTLANIAQIDFKQANLTCYQSLWNDVVIPFLDWINSAKSAKQTDILKGSHYSPSIEECMHGR